MKLSKEELKQIEDAVHAAEKKTSGEIVPMFVWASHFYVWTHFLCAIVGCTLGTGVGIWWMESRWHASVWDLLLLQTLGNVAGFCLPYFSPIKRALIPKKWAAEAVHQKSLAHFVSQGLSETRDRTGVLIYVSHLEHRVEILADKGIHSKCPPGYWDEEVGKLISGIREGKATQAFVQVIGEIGEKLSQSFPITAGDANELSNTLRTE